MSKLSKLNTLVLFADSLVKGKVVPLAVICSSLNVANLLVTQATGCLGNAYMKHACVAAYCPFAIMQHFL